MKELETGLLKVLLVWFGLYCGVTLGDKANFRHLTEERRLADVGDKSGFISIDCGMTEDSRLDSDDGLNYTSDAAFTDSGRNENVAFGYQTLSSQIYNTLRSFPDGDRNCYTLKPSQGKNSSYLIRAQFQYGNYDGLNKIPIFNMYIGVNFWRAVNLMTTGEGRFYELIYTPTTNNIYFCLGNIGQGTPFISALELRPLNKSLYKPDSGALMLLNRLDAGAKGYANGDYFESFRDDPHDRQWIGVPSSYNWDNLSTDATIRSSIDGYGLPPSVLKTAATPRSGIDSLAFHWSGFNLRNAPSKYEVYVYWHFAEIEKLGYKDSREFNISMSGNFQSGVLNPKYLEPMTIASSRIILDDPPLLDFFINKAAGSTLPPILNAMELYQSLDLPASATNEDDVNAVMSIKKNYGVPKIWQGDPCLPHVAWDGLNCSKSVDDIPRIISLNLSFSGLTGDVPQSLSSLRSLVYLNLSHNSLTGAVPDFLAELPSLSTIDLSSNNLSGQVPAALSKKVENGSVNLRLEDNPDLCVSHKCKKKNLKKILILLAALASLAVVFITAVAVYFRVKQRRRVGNINSSPMELKNQAFTYAEVVKLTNNFQKVIGKGGSGTVYHGCSKNGTPLAVKILNPSSAVSLQMFRTEVQLLMRVHHKSLVCLIGYCEEGRSMALIYEYVVNGDLQWHLSERSAKVLCWKERLQISIDVAEGLEYMHSGCKPPIIHRDMKTSNILLDDKMKARISDFGISRMYSAESQTHLSTNVAGTFGYIDPEYYSSRRLNEKSDVYSFGVVLLELITGRPPIMRATDEN